jgi:DNA-binding CsgD family transcriptional regulator
MDRKFIRLEQLLDKAVHDAQFWTQVCDELVELTGANGAILAPSTPSFRGVWMSCSTRLGATVEEYIQGGWHLNDPRERVTKPMIENGIATDDDIFVDRSAKELVPFYRHFLMKHNFGVLFALRLLTPNGYFGLMLHYDNNHPPITEHEKTLLRDLQVVIEAAITRAELEAHKRIYEFAQFFKGSNSEVFIFDADGHQSYLIDDRLRIKKHDRLHHLLPDEVSQTVQTELKDVLISDPNMSLSKTYRFQHGAKSINVLVVQIPPSLRHFFMQFKACAIRTEYNDVSAIKHSCLRENYNLTEAEITTVELLASGKTPAAIGDLMSLKPASVRQRLKTVYEKANVNSQIELVALYSKI